MPDHKFTNQLIRESSPYLLQHAHNPVEWHPWNDKTLTKAKSLDKMLLISIGYSACHWCHVMEKESFEDPGVAAIMNRHFICIKVDREERPDVDQVYMNAVQLITGSGGWPLNCFALPDGKPFFGGTYFRKNQWSQLLENIALLFTSSRKELEDQAGTLTAGMNSVNLINPPSPGGQLTAETLHSFVGRFRKQFDLHEGGFGHAPKFPMPVNIRFLIQYVHFTDDQDIRRFLDLTLHKMAFGGIYDQAGGGFARYSTDGQWKVPHFEKMLYDNAQLVSVYADAFRLSGNRLYKEIADETLQFVIRELTSPEGGFHSALDADSEGAEGRYYTWSAREFDQVTGSHADLLRKYYHVGGKGLWEENRNILLRTLSAEDFAKSQGLQPSAFKSILKPARARLLKAREKRIKPGLDNKILTSWNGMMIKGFADAYRATGNHSYLDSAVKSAGFITGHLMESDGRLFHCWNNGKAFINGFLEDYCFLAEGLLALYEVTFNEEYLQKANLLTGYALAHFYDPTSGFFFTTSSKDPPLVTRQQEIYDTVIPSSNSCMARVLLILGNVFERSDYLEIAGKMTDNVREKAIQYPSAFANWASVMLSRVFPFYTVVITGEEYHEKTVAIRKQLYPLVFFCGSKNRSELPVFRDRFREGETMIYICSGRECKLPTSSVEDALLQIAGRFRLTPE